MPSILTRLYPFEQKIGYFRDAILVSPFIYRGANFEKACGADLAH